MKRVLYIIVLMLTAGLCLQSCSDDETYAEQKERERALISAFIGRDVKITDSDGQLVADVGRINVISEDQFYAQGNMTDVTKNEYVLFGNSGVYMQIVRPGVGEIMKSGEYKRLMCRYVEFNIMRDSIQTRNDVLYWATRPEILEVTNTSGTFTASFNTSITGGGAMYSFYGSTSVPSGWLVPLSYIRVGRQSTPDGGIALVRLIVPHTSGQSDASNNVYPCFYQISYQEMR
ncbi:MAG: DUF4827 domain-containing protein [Clostridium sp.]|nr:DUF4827 domain-containing protein [Clostridium sp.]